MIRRSFLALGGAALAVPAARAGAQPAWSPVTFASVVGATVPAEQTTVRVPERHGRPGSGEITLPVVRFRSLAERPGAPILYLAGGPGASGLVSARQEIFLVLMRLREFADVVIFDQRGTGQATPSLLLSGSFDLPADQPLRGPAATARLAEIARKGSAEIKARGVDLSAYNTVENAEDIEAIRLALGAERLTLWGHSYGSHLGLAYLAAHPERVSAAMFGGVNDLPNRWRLPADGDALLARMDAAIGADRRLGPRIGGFQALVRRVFAALDRQPQTVSIGGKPVYVGREEIQTLIALNGGDIFFIRELPLILADMDRGDYGRAARALQALRATPQGTAMRHGMHIASGVSPARAALIARQTPGSLAGDAINFPYNIPAFTDGWGVADLGEAFRAPRPCDVPTLFMNGEFDGRTSVREARETMGRFSRAGFIEMGGVAHDFYGFSPAVVDAMLSFLNGRAIPARIEVLPVEFRSPDEPGLLKQLNQILGDKGVEPMVQAMRAAARAGDGPVFNVSTARTAGLILANQMKKPDAAMALLEAADELFPDDFSINRQLGTLYRASGDKAKALARFRKVKQLNAIASGADQDIQSVS